jgi:hypothetical protein
MVCLLYPLVVVLVMQIRVVTNLLDPLCFRFSFATNFFMHQATTKHEFLFLLSLVIPNEQIPWIIKLSNDSIFFISIIFIEKPIILFYYFYLKTNLVKCNYWISVIVTANRKFNSGVYNSLSHTVILFSHTELQDSGNYRILKSKNV